jgi:hypothetical protein
MEERDGDASWLDPLWAAALANWDEEAPHRAILAQCEAPGRLALAARRYRGVADQPEREPRAKKQLDAIAALAFAKLAPRPRPAESGRIWRILLLLLLVLATLLVIRQL